MMFLNALRDAADAHPHSVFVIALAVVLFSVTFVAVLEMIDRRQRRNEQRLRDRTDRVMASASKTSAAS